jgi:hypothetical protein
MSEQEKVESFYKWLVCKNPKIATCVELMNAINKFIDYKLTVLKNLEDSKEAMDYGKDFAHIIAKNFPEALNEE